MPDEYTLPDRCIIVEDGDKIAVGYINQDGEISYNTYVFDDGGVFPEEGSSIEETIIGFADMNRDTVVCVLNTIEEKPDNAGN